MNSYQSPIDGKAVFNRVCTVFTNSANKTSRIILSMLFLAMLSFQTYAQDDPWTLLKEENGVKVYYQVSACDSDASADPLDMLEGDLGSEAFQLKIINDNPGSKSITYPKITKLDDSDELETISVASGTTLLETCETAPKIILTQAEGDQYPTSITEFVAAFQIIIND